MRRRTFLLGLAGLGWAATRWRPAGAAGLRGRLVVPGDGDYEKARRVFNPRIETRPAALAYPVDADDVAAAVEWGRSRGLPIAMRCGGHSYEGFSLGPGLVIDVSELHAVQVQGEEVTVGAGCRQQAVADALFSTGRALPGGTCPLVGISGYTLGGGYGLASRAWGLGCDNLLSAELVDARGQKLSSADDPELFWALRGAGGGNFGVVTSLRFRTHAADSVVLLKRVWNVEQLERVMAIFWEGQLDPRLTLTVSLLPGEVHMTGLFLGPVGELPTLHWAQPREAWQRACPLAEAMAHLFGRGKKTSSAFLARSDFLKKPVPPKLLRQLLEAPGLTPRFIFDPYGGAIATGPDTAYVHRGYPALLQCLVYYKAGEEARGRAWLEQASRALAPHVSGQAYQNYPDSVRRDWPRAYYGAALPRLLALKRRLDPEGVFSYSQGLATLRSGSPAPPRPS